MSSSLLVHQERSLADLSSSTLRVDGAGGRLVALRGQRQAESLVSALRSGNGSMALVDGDVVLVFVPLGVRRVVDAEDRGSVTRLVAYARRIDPTIRATVSATITEQSMLGDAQRDLVELLDTRVSGAGESTGTVFVEDHWATLAIKRAAESFTHLFPMGSPLLALIEAARDPKDYWARTLLHWLANDRDFMTTGEQLHLHPNSVRYRVSRAEARFGLDLTDPQQLALAHLCGVLISAQL